MTVRIAPRTLHVTALALAATALATAQTTAIAPTHYLKSPEAARRDGVSYIEMDPSWSPGNVGSGAAKAAESIGFAEPEEPWWILHTSRTTGAPSRAATSIHRFVKATPSTRMALSAVAKSFFTPVPLIVMPRSCV